MTIDPVLFGQQFQKFLDHIYYTSGEEEFHSFSSNRTTDEDEGYKYVIFEEARDALDFYNWKTEDIGSGKIHEASVKAIYLRENINNLIDWRLADSYKKGEINQKNLAFIEQSLFNLYHNVLPEEEVFEDLVKALGANYSLIAYFFFIKDRSRFVPVSTSRFEKALELVGVEDLKLSHNCNWDNYQQFISYVEETQILLLEYDISDVSLLDAHSFLWMISGDKVQNTPEDIKNNYKLPESSTARREVVIRKGQDLFRKRVLNYWKGIGSLTNTRLKNILVAAHIKPFKTSSHEEKYNEANGLLLTPTEHSLFDMGVISFDDDGKIIISEKYDQNELKKLGINEGMQVEGLSEGHLKFLAYHRENVFQK